MPIIEQELRRLFIPGSLGLYMLGLMRYLLRGFISYFSNICLSTLAFVIIAMVLYIVPDQYGDFRVYSTIAALGLFATDQLVLRTVSEIHNLDISVCQTIREIIKCRR